MSVSMNAVRDVAAADYFYLEHVQSGLALTPAEGRGAAGTRLSLMQVNDGLGDLQLWTLTADGLLLNKASGLVAQVADGSAVPGAVVTIEPARGSAESRTAQLWSFSAAGQLTSRLPGAMLLMPSRPAERAEVRLATRETPTSPAQCWRMRRSVPVAPAFFYIENVQSGRVLTPVQVPPVAGTRLQTMQAGWLDLDAAGSQLWSWTGSGALINKAGCLVLDVSGGKAALGGPVALSPAEPPSLPDRQLWSLDRDGRITTELDGNLVLGLASSSDDAPVVLVERSPDPDPRQCWRIRRAVVPEPVSASRALHLNGTTQAVSLGNQPPPLGDFTVEAWVRTTTGGPIISASQNVAKCPGLVFAIQRDGSILALVSGAEILGRQQYMTRKVQTASTEVTDGLYHHVAAVQKDRVLTVYLDGIPVDLAFQAFQGYELGPSPSPQAMFIGSFQWQWGKISDRTWLDGDLAEVRLWRSARTDAQIPAYMHHAVSDTDPDLVGRWAFGDDTARDSSPAHRNGILVGAPAFIDSDVEIVPAGDFYLITQAKLIQDYLHDPTGASPPTEIAGYRVSMTVRDGNDLGTQGFVVLTLNDPATAPAEGTTLHFPDGTSTTLTADRPQLTARTDAQGLLSFTTDANGRLACPMLRAEADFMTDGSRLVIAPDRQAHAALAAVTGNALLGRDADGNPLPGKTAILPAATDAATADAAAQAVSQVMSSAVQANAQSGTPQMRMLADPQNTPLARPYVPRYQLAGLVAGGYDPGTDAIATHQMDRDTTVVRLLTPDNAEHSHWSFDYEAFQAHSVQDASDQLRRLSTLEPAGDLAKKILPDFGPDTITGARQAWVGSAVYNAAAQRSIVHPASLTSWLSEHVAAAARVLVNRVEVTIVDDITKAETTVKTLVVTAINAVNEAAYAVIQSVEEAIDVVGGFFKRLGADIAKVVAFLKELFDWGDILNLQRVMFTYISNLGPFLTQVTQSVLDKASDAIETVKHDVDRRFGQWRDAVIGAGAQRQANTTSTSPPMDIKSSYVSTMLSYNLGGGPGKAGRTPGAIAATQQDGLLDLAASISKDWLSSIGDTWIGVPGTVAHSPIGSIHDVRTFFSAGIELLLNSVQALFDAIIDSLDDLVHGLKDHIAALIQALIAFGVEPLPRIPVVTDFYDKVVMRGKGAALSPLSLVALAGATVGSVTYKAVTGGSAPLFTDAEADAFCAMTPAEYTWLGNPFATSAMADATAPDMPRGDLADKIIFSMTCATSAASFVFALIGAKDDAEFVAKELASMNSPVPPVADEPAFGILDKIGVIVGFLSWTLSIADFVAALLRKKKDAGEMALSVLMLALPVVGSVSSLATFRSAAWGKMNDYCLTVLGVITAVLVTAAWASDDSPRDKVIVLNGVSGILTSIGLFYRIMRPLIDGIVESSRADVDPDSKLAAIAAVSEYGGQLVVIGDLLTAVGTGICQSWLADIQVSQWTAGPGPSTGGAEG
jgi:hypothetical protein